MFDRLPDWLRPTQRGIADNIVSTALLAVVGMVFSCLLTWLAGPHTDREWVSWFLYSLMILSLAWVAGAYGWRVLYPLPPPSKPEVPPAAPPSASDVTLIATAV